MTLSESTLTLPAYLISIRLIACLTTAVLAQVSNDNITTVRAVLDSAGLQHVEVWESERAFNADGWDYRCSNHTGGLFAALSIVSNCACGLDRSFHWVDYGSSGYKQWSTLPVNQAFFAPALLHNIALLGGGATFVATQCGNPALDVYAFEGGGEPVDDAESRLVVLAFNRRDLPATEHFEFVLPAGILSTDIRVFECVVCRNPFATIECTCGCEQRLVALSHSLMFHLLGTTPLL